MSLKHQALALVNPGGYLSQLLPQDGDDKINKSANKHASDTRGKPKLRAVFVGQPSACCSYNLFYLHNFLDIYKVCFCIIISENVTCSIKVGISCLNIISLFTGKTKVSSELS